MKGTYTLRNAVRTALGASLMATMAVPATAAEEEEGKELERVTVTGSRIQRIQLEGATPVVTLDREDIEATGFENISDVLRNLSFNSFGSIKEESGNTAQSQATLSLRGIGSGRTLILLDGRRLPGSPVLDASSQDLNTIPFAAVERIEVLSDGASAIYGSDAIGGVVNIILRKDFEGVEAKGMITEPSREGGRERSFSVTGGFSGPNGNLTYAVDSYQREIIFSRDRHFTKPRFLGGDANNYFNYSGNSIHGRNIQEAPTYATLQSMIDSPVGSEVCDVYGENFIPHVLQYPGFGSVCSYNYAAIAAETADLDRKSFFMDANYNVTPDTTFYMRTMYSKNESLGRYAPAAGAFLWTGPTLPQQNVTVDGETYTLAELNTYDYVRYRFTENGPRDTTQTNIQHDIQMGFEGYAAGMDWSVGYHHNQYDLAEWGTGYIQRVALAQEAQDGWDPRHPDASTQADHVANFNANSNRRGRTDYDRLDFGLQFDGPSIGSAPMAFFVGGEYRDTAYFDETLAQMEAGNILGTAGGSSGGERQAWALFGEASMPFTDTFELSVAARHDDYSDYGDSQSGKLAARWQPTDAFLMRGSIGTGFRAPTLDQLHQAPAQSFSFANDFVACDNAGLTIEQCLQQRAGQHETFFNNNPNLDAETSTNYSAGMVFDAGAMNGPDLNVSLDYYYIEIEDAITFISTQDAFWLEILGLINGVDGVSVDRTGTTLVEVRPVNFRSFDTQGLDFKADYRASLGGAGELGLNFNLSYVLEYNSRDIIVGPTRDITGRNGVPQYRANMGLRWSMGDHMVHLQTYYVPSQNEFTTLNPNFDSTDPSTFYFVENDANVRAAGGEAGIPAHREFNLTYAWQTPFDSEIAVGVNNLTDEDPALNSNGTAWDTSLYNIWGRRYFVEYTQRF